MGEVIHETSFWSVEVSEDVMKCYFTAVCHGVSGVNRPHLLLIDSVWCHTQVTLNRACISDISSYSPILKCLHFSIWLQSTLVINIDNGHSERVNEILLMKFIHAPVCPSIYKNKWNSYLFNCTWHCSWFELEERGQFSWYQWALSSLYMWPITTKGTSCRPSLFWDNGQNIGCKI